MNFKVLKEATVKTVNTLIMVLIILVGGLIFATFLVLSGVAAHAAATVASLPLPPSVIIIIIVVLYIVMGMFIDGSSMLVLSVPVLAPIVASLGYSLIWFGVLTTIMVETGAITPPVGINIYVLKAQISDATLEDCFRGVVPFYAGVAVLIILITAFPIITLWLPSFIGR